MKSSYVWFSLPSRVNPCRRLRGPCVGSRLHTAQVFSGVCRSSNRSPTHTGLRSTAGRRTGGVYPLSATFSRDHLSMSLRAPAARARTSPWPPRSPPARPLSLTCLRICSLDSPDSRTSTWPSLAAPPAPRTHGAHRISGLAGGASGFRQCKGVAAGGVRPRTCPWSGGCPAHLHDGC